MNENGPSTLPEYIPPNAVESISRAEIDISIATAIKYPHHAPGNLSRVKADMMSFATLDQETAEGCFYTLPRGGKNIEGPSVRLAEIAVACYGNLRAGTRIVAVVADGDTPHVVVQAVAHDLEKNTYISIEKRRRIVKKKAKPTIDEDDINLAANACSAICFRDAVFKVIPLALIKPVFEAARKVAIGDQKTLADRRARCFQTFAAMGIAQDKILAKIERHSVEDVNLDDLVTLTGLRNAIKEGEINIDEAFATASAPAGAQQPAAHAPAQTGHQQAQQAASAPSTATTTTTAPVVNKPPQTTAPAAVTSGTSAPTTAEAPKRRGRPPLAQKMGKLTPKQAAESRAKGENVAEEAIAYPEGTTAADYDGNGDLLPEEATEGPAATQTAPAGEDQDLAAMGLAPEPEPAPVAAPEPAAAPAAPALPEMTFGPLAGEDNQTTAKRALGYLGMLMEDTNVTADQLMKFCVSNNIARAGQKLTDLATVKLFNLGKNFKALAPKMALIK